MLLGPGRPPAPWPARAQTGHAQALQAQRPLQHVRAASCIASPTVAPQATLGDVLSAEDAAGDRSAAARLVHHTTLPLAGLLTPEEHVPALPALVWTDEHQRSGGDDSSAPSTSGRGEGAATNGHVSVEAHHAAAMRSPRAAPQGDAGASAEPTPRDASPSSSSPSSSSGSSSRRGGEVDSGRVPGAQGRGHKGPRTNSRAHSRNRADNTANSCNGSSHARGPSRAAAQRKAEAATPTLDELRRRAPVLQPLQMLELQKRLAALAALLKLDEAAALRTCDGVPGLLAATPEALNFAWRRVRHRLSLDDAAARRVCTQAPLLLVLPQTRLLEAELVLSAALSLRPKQARALLSARPNLATHAPATLAAKLATLQRLLGPDAPPERVWCAVRSAPSLLTLSVAAMEAHHSALQQLLGEARLQAVLRKEPALLARAPASVAAKMRVLQEAFGTRAHPQAVAALVSLRPSVLSRSPDALRRGCRALSVWALPPRTRLRMVAARPALLSLSWQEVHGRCRWLRRLMLHSGYFHSALRRVHASVLAELLCRLPCAWPRLLYLADSSQEGSVGIMEAAECEQAAFEARFPEYRSWHAWKLKQMGADNPWRGARRIRGIGKPAVALSATAAGARLQATRGAPRLHLTGGVRSAAAGGKPATPQAEVAVVMQEACEVRSGGAVLLRPRRVVLHSIDAAESGSASEAEIAPAAAEGEAAAEAIAAADAAAAGARKRKGRSKSGRMRQGDRAGSGAEGGALADAGAAVGVRTSAPEQPSAEGQAAPVPQPATLS